MKEVLFWTGGQPFSTQRICDLIAVATENDNIVAGKEREWLANIIQT